MTAVDITLAEPSVYFLGECTRYAFGCSNNPISETKTMNNYEAIGPVSSEDEFVPPPPPPPRILLLRGSCLAKVFEFLDETEKASAVQSCKLFRDALNEFEEVDLNCVDQQTEHENEDGPLAPPAPPSESPETPVGNRNKFIISVPPGKLGIRLENKPTKLGTIVTLVSDGSPLEGKIFVGDVILQVNGVDVERMDIYGKCSCLLADVFADDILQKTQIRLVFVSTLSGILEVFQRYQNEEKSITFMRPDPGSVATADNSIVSAAEIMTPAVDNRKAAREQLSVPHEICEPVSESFVHENDNTVDTTDELNVTSICSNQSKTIIRINSATPATPFNDLNKIPSIDSDLQLESLDLNSYESLDVSPLTPAVSPGVSSIDRPIIPRFLEKRTSDAIPFDELDTNARLPEFPAATVKPVPFVVSETSETEAGETLTNLGSVASFYEDDDTITSATSSYFSSLGTDDTSYTEEQAGYLSQFADAAMFGDVTLFTSLVNEIIDSAKHAAKLVVTEKGDAIDDQGPIKIGDNYYTHQEAIKKWKKARDKLKESKYQENDEKLQRKLEKAAMDAAQLMAATKTFDLAARRSGHHMEKKEGRQAVKKALANLNDASEDDLAKICSLSGASTWEREELEIMRSREIEKRKKKKAAQDPSMSIHQLISQFSLFGFSLGDVETDEMQFDSDKDDNHDDTESHSNTTPVKTRFDFLKEPSETPTEDQSMTAQLQHLDQGVVEEEYLKKQRFQYLTSMDEDEEDEPFDCIADSGSSRDGAKETDETVAISVSGDAAGSKNTAHGESRNTNTLEDGIETMDIFSSQSLEACESNSDDDREELEWAARDPLQRNDAIRTASPSLSVQSRSLTSPSPATATSYTSSVANMTNATNASSIAMTNASSITELAGCARNRGEMEPSVSTEQSDECSMSSSLDDLGSVEEDIEIGQDQPDDLENVDTIQQPDIELVKNVDIEQLTENAAQSVAISNDTTASSTKDDSSVASEESDGARGVEVESFYSGDQSGTTSYTGTTASESAFSSYHSRALTNATPKRTVLNGLDSQPATILEEAVCFLLEACQGDLSECPSAHSKYTLDSMMGSEYGTEIIFNARKANPPLANRLQPERIVTERKPRIASKQSKGIVTPSPTKKSKSSSPNKSKRMNPLKLITKTQSTKKTTPKKTTVVSRQTPPTQELAVSTSVLARQSTPASARPPTPKGLKMGFGVMRSRSAG